MKGYQLCPYCRAGYVSLIKINDKYIRPDLDHFYPKSKHYYLSITIDNLIPGCLLCNQRLKKDIDPSIDFKNTQEIFKKIKFEVDIINKYIYIINLDEFNKNEYEWIENMCISKIYSYHTEIFDNIYEKYEKYRKSNIKDMAKALNLDEEYIKNLIFWEFKIMKEKTIAGKSGLGDCTKKNKTGEKQSITHDFFSIIYKKNIIRRSTFILKNSSEKCENPA